MRIISFNKKWDKLQQPEFTTFRYPRSDTDWWVGEVVQVFYKSCSPQREKLGIAEITGKEKRELDPFFTDGTFMTPLGIPLVTDEEVRADGFESPHTMTDYMEKQYGLGYISLFNKLTLRWLSNG